MYGTKKSFIPACCLRGNQEQPAKDFGGFVHLMDKPGFCDVQPLSVNQLFPCRFIGESSVHYLQEAERER